MRVFLLLVLLASALGLAGYTAHRRYPMEKVQVPGSARVYRLLQGPDRCSSGQCFLSVVFLTRGTDLAIWRADAEGLEPWLVAKARSGGQRGAVLLAVKPGFAHLFPPTKARWFAMGGRGSRWKIVAEGDGQETIGITE